MADANTVDELAAQLVRQRQRVHELTTLNNLASQLPAIHVLQALLQDTVGHARHLLGTDLAYLALTEADGTLFIRVTDGSTGHRLRGMTLHPTVGLAGRVARTAEPIQTRDYLADTDLIHAEAVDRVAGAEHLRTILGVPLLLRGEVIGVLMVSQRIIRTFDTSEVSLLASFAAIAAVAIDNARLIAEYRRVADDLHRANAALTATVDGVRQAATLHEALVEIVAHGGGVADVLTRLSAVVPGTVLFGAVDGQPMAAAAGHLTDAGPLRDPDGVRAALRTRSPRTWVNGSTVSVPVSAMRAPMGVLQAWLDPDHRPSADDALVRLLERAGMTIALVASSERAVAEADRRTAAEVLDQILHGRTGRDAEAFARRARSVGLDLTVPHVVVAAEPADDGLARLLDRARDGVRTHGGLTAAVDGVVVLVTPLSVAQAAEWARTDRGAPTTGVAGPVLTSDALAAAYDEALGCVRVLHALGRTGDVATVGELGPFRVLLSHAGRQDAVRFVRAAVGALEDHDRARGTELVRTADEFFRQGRHQANTAARLRIHPNTLVQRLERITALLGPGWREDDRGQDVQLALRLRRMVDVRADPAPR